MLYTFSFSCEMCREFVHDRPNQFEFNTHSGSFLSISMEGSRIVNDLDIEVNIFHCCDKFVSPKTKTTSWS